MNVDNLIKRWLEKEIISKEQSSLMLKDLDSFKKQQGTSKFVIAVSIIGALLLGIGIILFIASNWWLLPKFAKIGILLFFTFGINYTGFYLKYHNKNFPKIGTSLIFLSTLVFGASLCLIAQVYHTKANTHWLVLIWLIGIIPLIYSYLLTSVAVLSSILFFVWCALFFEFDTNPIGFYLISGIFIFAFGGLNYFKNDYIKIAKSYRLIGIIVSLFALFLLSFKALSDADSLDNLETHTIAIILSFAFITVTLILINSHFNFSKSLTSKIEVPCCLVVIASVISFYFLPSDSSLYAILFNLIFFGIVLTILYVGYTNDDLKLVSIATFYLSILILARYFDFCWKLLPRSVFFIVGGLILLSGVYLFERQRTLIKKRIETK